MVSVWFFLSWARHPLRGPGHPPEGAPTVPDDPCHGGLLLRLHAPGLDASQLNRLRLWTFAGQRHGESGRLLVEPGEVGGHRVVGRTSAPLNPTLLHFLHRSRSLLGGRGRYILAKTRCLDNFRKHCLRDYSLKFVSGTRDFPLAMGTALSSCLLG